jgi:hypothetical protein
VIDILAYRVAKGLASGLVLLLVWVDLKSWISWIAVVLVVAWIQLTVMIVRNYRRRVDTTEKLELQP